jgi:hypothetical protein
MAMTLPSEQIWEFAVCRDPTALTRSRLSIEYKTAARASVMVPGRNRRFGSGQMVW